VVVVVVVVLVVVVVVVVVLVVVVVGVVGGGVVVLGVVAETGVVVVLGVGWPPVWVKPPVASWWLTPACRWPALPGCPAARGGSVPDPPPSAALEVVDASEALVAAITVCVVARPSARRFSSSGPRRR
jgi:hypothetical protein